MPGKLWIPVGIPGCGKSTWAYNSGYMPVSTDVIRGQFGDVQDQSNNDLVFKTFHDVIGQGLHAHLDVVADATNLRDFARAKLVEIADRAGAAKHVVIFANPLEAFQRNRARDRKVPEDVMYRMVDQYEKALRDIEFERIAGKYTSVQKIRSYK